MDPVFGHKVMSDEFENFNMFLKNIGQKIEEGSIKKNQHLKSLLQESRKDLVDMMDESYQDAFNIEIKKGK
jgi:hypothetical protein